MALPEGLARFIPPGQEEIQNFISSAASQSIRPYSTNEEYLYAMKEDLAEWLKELHHVHIHAENFIDFLQDGILLCKHANWVNKQANEFRRLHKGDPMLKKIILPSSKIVRHNPGRHLSTFFARDNVANFIDWCRNELLISEVVMFESNDLILRKNEKNFILCLLEMARRGSKFGVPAPVLIQMEQDIDEEIKQDLREEQSEEEEEEEEEEEREVKEPPKQKVPCDFKSLDEMVQYILGLCSCPTQFPMVKVSEGKYKIGNSKTLIFMRILRNHVMVRVGGGWDTLEHYLDKHDPCRCNRHKVEQKITARIRDLGLVLTPEEERQLISRAKRDSRDFKVRNRSLTSQAGQGLSIKQATDIMEKAGRTSRTRNTQGWSDIRSQSLPGFEGRMSSAPSIRPSKVVTQTSDSVNRVSKIGSRRSEAVNRSNELVQDFEVKQKTVAEEGLAPPSTNRTRSHSPAPTRGSKFNSLPRNSKTPEIKVTAFSNDAMNRTYPVGGRHSNSNTPRTSNTLNQPTGDKVRSKSPIRSKTPTPDSLRSVSTVSMSYSRDYRRSVTPTPSTKRPQFSVSRARSPGPDKILQNSVENKRPVKGKGPPSSYRNSETLPRNHRPMERSPRRETTTATPSQASAGGTNRFNSLPRPSSSMSRSSTTETDFGKSSTLSASTRLSHHRSLQDVRQPQRPKSAQGTYSTHLSTVPKNTGRKTVATTSGTDSMQRLSSKIHSRSMDNLSIQKQFNSPATIKKNQFFDRLSQPKSTPKSRAQNNLTNEDVLVVQRKGEGRHSLQRNSTQGPVSSAAGPRSTQDHEKLVRESSASSDTSSHGAQQQLPITPSDLRLRIKRDEGERKTFRGQGSVASSTPSPSKDSALASSLRLSVSMMGSPDSPTSHISYSWAPDSGGDELESPSSSQPAHTPKIINRSKKGSHLKAPPKSSVSQEEIIHVVRNPEGHHQWEHTGTSLEQSQELIDLSPYKDQLSPRSSYGDKTPRPSVRKTSSSSDSSAVSPESRHPPRTRVSKAHIQLGKPQRSSTPARLEAPAELRVSQPKHDVRSNSSSSVASSKSSVDGHRKPKVSEEVRSMLFSEDGRAKPASNSVRSSHPSTTPRSSMRQRPTTPKKEVSPRMSQARSRPLTPKTQTRSITPRPKTPEVRRSTLTRQEKLKSYDGPSAKKEPEPQDKESRMLREFEKELSENRKILASSGDSIEEPKSGNESAENKVEYDYNGRRVRKKPLRSKSPSNLRSKSTPKMNRMSSFDSEATNHSYERADSNADSEDFEVAMAMSGGAKYNTQSALRSRSVDDFLDERGPRPRRDSKNDSHKSRIPTPIHVNSGRKSATGVPYHDTKASKSAIRSNIEGVGSHELESANQRMGQRSYQHGEKARKEDEKERHHSQKENIRPVNTASRLTIAKEPYELENQNCFKFGRHGNSRTKPLRKSAESTIHNGSQEQDFVDGRQQYLHREDITAGFVDQRYMSKSENYNSNNNNSNTIGQSMDQSEEPIPPPRKKGGHHCSNPHSSPADLPKPVNQIHSRQSAAVNQALLHHSTRGQQHHIPHDRNDSGIEPDSPGSLSATSMRSTFSREQRAGTRSGTSSSPMFPSSPGSTQAWGKNQPPPAYHQTTGAPQHGIVEMATGKYYYVAPAQQDPRTRTGYDVSRQHQPPSQAHQSPILYQQHYSPPYSQSTYQPVVYNSQQPVHYQSNGPEYSPASPSISSSAYSSAGPDSRRTSGSTIEDTRPRPHIHPPIYEQESVDVSQQIQKNLLGPETPITRNQKRKNFNDFVTDNQKLKDSLNKLGNLYSTETEPNHGSAFQLEDDPFMDERSSGERSQESYGNAFTIRDSLNSLAQHTFPGKVDQENTQGYSTFPRAFEVDNNNGDVMYTNNGMGQYLEGDTPPAPPPRRKAFEKQKLGPPATNYYSKQSNGPNQRFQIPNGLEVRQSSKERLEEYV